MITQSIRSLETAMQFIFAIGKRILYPKILEKSPVWTL